MSKNELRLKRKYEFDAAHSLPFHEGKCKNFHGHRYVLEVEIVGEVQTTGPETGMIMDFKTLDAYVNEILELLDHSNLNDQYKNPTAELMVQDIAARLNVQEFKLRKVTLWETPRSCAIVEFFD